MSAPYFFELIGHVYVASHSAHAHKELTEKLASAGFDAAQVKKGLELCERGEKLLKRMGQEMPDYKSLDHNIHAGVMEVEMWLQSVKLKFRKAGFSSSITKLVVGHDLHAHDHTVTAVTQALRGVGYLRSLDDKQIESLGGESVVRDIIMRGNTMVNKLYKVADAFVTPTSLMPRTSPIFRDFDALNAEMSTWIVALLKAANKVKNIKVLGLIGHVPDDRGLPVGGAAFNVTLHEQAITTPPVPGTAERTSGWSVGRQGNRENQEHGWTSAGFGSVMGD